MVCDTLSHGSDHLCLIWKESIHNCRCYGADTACGTDVFGEFDLSCHERTDRRTDRRTEWNQYTPPPQQLRCAGGIMTTWWQHIAWLASTLHSKYLHCAMDVGIIKLGLHWFRQRHDAFMAPSHYLNECWLISNFTGNALNIYIWWQFENY